MQSRPTAILIAITSAGAISVLILGWKWGLVILFGIGFLIGIYVASINQMIKNVVAIVKCNGCGYQKPRDKE